MHSAAMPSLKEAAVISLAPSLLWCGHLACTGPSVQAGSLHHNLALTTQHWASSLHPERASALQYRVPARGDRYVLHRARLRGEVRHKGEAGRELRPLHQAVAAEVAVVQHLVQAHAGVPGVHDQRAAEVGLLLLPTREGVGVPMECITPEQIGEEVRRAMPGGVRRGGVLVA